MHQVKRAARAQLIESISRKIKRNKKTEQNKSKRERKRKNEKITGAVSGLTYPSGDGANRVEGGSRRGAQVIFFLFFSGLTK